MRDNARKWLNRNPLGDTVIDAGEIYRDFSRETTERTAGLTRFALEG
jgi:hypothetical protein